MQIELPIELIERLQRRAQSDPEAGNAGVVRRALDTLDWLDEDHPTPDQLNSTLRQLDRSMEEVQSERTQSLDEAKAQVQQALGLSTPQ